MAELGLVVILVDLVVVVLGIALRVLAAGNGHRVANYLTETEHIG